MGTDILTLVLVIAGLALAGMVKGIVGLGFPIIAMSILTVFLDPKSALGLVAIPLMATNAWQAFQGKNYAAVFKRFRRFWPFILTLTLGTWAGALAVAEVDTDILLAALGFVAVMFAVVSVLHPALEMSEKREKLVGPVTGLGAGVMGGLTTVHGPPIIMYLEALGLKKDEFVGTIGLILFAGTIPMVLSYIYSGVLGSSEAVWSSMALIPVFAGMLLGERVRKKIDQKLFKNIIVFILFMLGLNLLRRAFL